MGPKSNFLKPGMHCTEMRVFRFDDVSSQAINTF
uniref:Uncharacterized protein n=1 Tax=Arundo donax TaxID=35708 RepID=A0A0A9B128_ARUDO